MTKIYSIFIDAVKHQPVIDLYQTWYAYFSEIP